MARSSRKKQPQKKNETTKWIVRGVAGVILVILVVLALMDRSAKTNASTTTTAWLNMLQAATEEERELHYSELPKHVSGSPKVKGEASSGQVVYSWNGVFRSYATTITCEGGDPPIVVRIEGPGS